MPEHDLDQRVYRIERQNRRLRWAVLTLAVLLIANSLAGIVFRRPGLKVGILSAGQVQLHDERGNLVGLFHAAGPRINLFDDKGKDRVRLSIINGIPELALFDEAERERVYLRVVQGEPMLSLRDGQGVDRVGLFDIEDAPHVELRDSSGRAGATISLSAEGQPLATTFDANGHAHAERLAR